MNTLTVPRSPTGNFYGDYLVFTDSVAKYPPDIEKAYLALGLCDETCDELQRADAANVHKELGDGNWYAARLAKSFDFDYVELIAEAKRRYRGNTYDMPALLVTISRTAAGIAGRIKKFLRDSHEWNDEKMGLFRVDLRERLISYYLLSMLMCDALWHSGARTVYSFDDMLRSNALKLGARLANGTIHGDGDDR